MHTPLTQLALTHLQHSWHSRTFNVVTIQTMHDYAPSSELFDDGGPVALAVRLGLCKVHAPQTKILENRANIPERIFNSRRQLIPIFDKPAFSRISLHSEPRIVVKIFGKFVKRQVCVKNGDELPTADFQSTFQMNVSQIKYSRTVPEIPESRFIVHAFKRRFLPV